MYTSHQFPNPLMIRCREIKFFFLIFSIKLYGTSDQKLAYNLLNFEQNLRDEPNERVYSDPLIEFKNSAFRLLQPEKFEVENKNC